MHHDVSWLCSLGTILLHVFSKLQHQNAKLFCEPYKHFDNYRNLRNLTYITIRSLGLSNYMYFVTSSLTDENIAYSGKQLCETFDLVLSMRHDSQTIARFESIVLNDKLSTYTQLKIERTQLQVHPLIMVQKIKLAKANNVCS